MSFTDNLSFFLLHPKVQKTFECKKKFRLADISGTPSSRNCPVLLLKPALEISLKTNLGFRRSRSW